MRYIEFTIYRRSKEYVILAYTTLIADAGKEDVEEKTFTTWKEVIEFVEKNEVKEEDGKI